MPDRSIPLSEVPLPEPKDFTPRRPRLCKGCGKELPTGSPKNKQYHSECLKERARASANLGYASAGDIHGVVLPTGTVGAVGELGVCADLLRRGFHVFRSVSPNAPCDIVVLRPDLTPRRVEVRTGLRHSDGSITWAKKPTDTCDAYAVVLYVGAELQIHYIPELP